MKRVFIGLKIEPGEMLKEVFFSLKAGLSAEKIKWTDLANIHLTLVFLGDTGEDKIPQLYSMLKEKCEGWGKFDLILKGAGVFRSMSDPRILWVGIERSDSLLQLNKVISDGLKSLDITVEDRPYNPHLTLGRIKHISNKDSLNSHLKKYQNTAFQTVNVNEVILYESILLQAGPLYKPLEKVSL